MWGGEGWGLCNGNRLGVSEEPGERAGAAGAQWGEAMERQTGQRLATKHRSTAFLKYIYLN